MLCSYQQMRRDYKIKFTDKLKANLWIHLDLAKVHRGKGLTSPYIVSFLHFLNLDNILNLPFVVTEARFDLTRLVFALFFACQIYTRASLRNQNKCKPSIQRKMILTIRISTFIKLKDTMKADFW